MKFQLTEKGVVALVTLVSCTTLLGLGVDHVVGCSLLAVIVGYFGIEVFPWPQIRKRKEKR